MVKLDAMTAGVGVLDGKVALVTGGGSGIGRAVALAFAREGAKVVVSDVRADDGEETLALLRSAGGDAIFIRLDVTRPEAQRTAVACAEARFGSLSVACNNAGFSRGPTGEYRPVADVALEDWRAIMEVNLDGVFHGLQVQIPAMVRAGGGAIVNVASVMGSVAAPGLGPYVAAKHGVVGLTRAAALDHAAAGVRINCVAPGYIDTPMLAKQDAAMRERLAGLHPLGRIGRPEEIAELVVWLCSDQASFVTGAYYPCDGGYLAQ